jgi:hypothetical protein
MTVGLAVIQLHPLTTTRFLSDVGKVERQE